MDDDRQQEPARSRKSSQFGMMGLLLILTLSSVVAAVLGGLLRQGSNRMTFIVLSVAAPMGLMIALSLWQQIRRIGRR